MEDSGNNPSLLSQSDDDLEHPLDLSALYNSESISMLAAQDERIKRDVGPTLDESNIHLLSNFDAQNDWYPGFSEVVRLKERYLRENPQVRATNEAVTGRCNDGYESES
ncbi:hypothetical protein APHAL10511_000547 [Amanita phalloides]|nr:hypothetical protein APHAL10511_000547 [Amanita phalloides]